MISASAPGKVVLWGEYAVLDGAPAMVMAVDRFALCSIEPTGDDWLFTTRGFPAPALRLSCAELAAQQPPERGAAGVFWHVLRELQHSTDPNRLPAGARVITDTRGFYADHRKYGIGSSAAVCTAAYGACCELLGADRDFRQALRIHNAVQDKRGSGIDVAAAFYGGTLRFQSQVAVPAELPANLLLRFIWTGEPASTSSHIQRFNAWLARGQKKPLHALADTCRALFERTDPSTFARYCSELKHLDSAADLGIYSAAHKTLDRLAIAAEVVYKPCGAGGGDIGVAISDNAPRLDAFIAAAVDHGFASIALEKAQHGVQISR